MRKQTSQGYARDCDEGSCRIAHLNRAKWGKAGSKRGAGRQVLRKFPAPPG